MTKQTKWQTLKSGTLAILKDHWWKIILIVLTGGLVFSGFQCKWGQVEVNKKPIEPWKKKSAISNEAVKK